MVNGFAGTAGEDDATGAELRGPVGDEHDFFLVRDQEDRSPRRLSRWQGVEIYGVGGVLPRLLVGAAIMP